MELADFAPVLFILLFVLLQYVSGMAILPGRFGFRLVSSNNPHQYRFIVHMWIAAAVVCTIVIVGCHL